MTVWRIRASHEVRNPKSVPMYLFGKRGTAFYMFSVLQRSQHVLVSFNSLLIFVLIFLNFPHFARSFTSRFLLPTFSFPNVDFRKLELSQASCCKLLDHEARHRKTPKSHRYSAVKCARLRSKTLQNLRCGQRPLVSPYQESLQPTSMEQRTRTLANLRISWVSGNLTFLLFHNLWPQRKLLVAVHGWSTSLELLRVSHFSFFFFNMLHLYFELLKLHQPISLQLLGNHFVKKRWPSSTHGAELLSTCCWTVQRLCSDCLQVRCRSASTRSGAC